MPSPRGADSTERPCRWQGRASVSQGRDQAAGLQEQIQRGQAAPARSGAPGVGQWPVAALSAVFRPAGNAAGRPCRTAPIGGRPAGRREKASRLFFRLIEWRCSGQAQDREGMVGIREAGLLHLIRAIGAKTAVRRLPRKGIVLRPNQRIGELTAPVRRRTHPVGVQGLGHGAVILHASNRGAVEQAAERKGDMPAATGSGR